MLLLKLLLLSPKLMIFLIRYYNGHILQRSNTGWHMKYLALCPGPTQNIAASLISFAMHFWIKPQIIAISFETVVLLKKVANDSLTLLFFKFASLFFITIPSRSFARIKSNFEISFVISENVQWFNLSSYRLC